MSLPIQITIVIISIIVGLYLILGVGDFVICFVRNKWVKNKLVKIHLPSWIEDMCPTSYEIKSVDNLTLRAKYIAYPNAKRIFIMAHGFTGNMYHDLEEIARHVYQKYEASLLLISHRCHHESDGHIITFGYKEHIDISLWAKFVNENISNTLPIYLWGFSMGGFSVLASTRLTLPNNVKGIIADSAFTKGYEEVKVIAKKLYKFIGPIFMPLMCLCAFLTGFSLSKYDTRKILKNTELPVLFIHGTSDEIVPTYMSKENYENKTNGYRDILIVEGSRHIESFHVDKENYYKHLDNLFKVAE